MTIFVCKCGAMKTGQPYRSAGQAPWICSTCEPAKKSMAAARAARSANGGRFHAGSDLPQEKVDGEKA